MLECHGNRVTLLRLLTHTLIPLSWCWPGSSSYLTHSSGVELCVEYHPPLQVVLAGLLLLPHPLLRCGIMCGISPPPLQVVLAGLLLLPRRDQPRGPRLVGATVHT